MIEHIGGQPGRSQVSDRDDVIAEPVAGSLCCFGACEVVQRKALNSGFVTAQLSFFSSPCADRSIHLLPDLIARARLRW